MKKTTLRQNVQTSDRQWYIIDAKDQRIGILATKIARVLTGKHRADFTPHADGGDYVVVLNAEKIQSSGKKEEDKKYYRHSRYFGNLKTTTLAEMRVKHPNRILQKAVAGMLPKTKLRKNQLKRLHLVIGEENPHAAQKPISLPLETL